MAKTYREVLDRASSFLEERQLEGHSILYVFLGRKNWRQTDWLLKMNQPITPADEAQVQADLAQLSQNIPPQYLLGWEEFYGHRFKVTQDTLIPRPETEELVELCLKENSNQENLKVVDIGTGTGAIAISLKRAQPSWQVLGLDISEAALKVAATNAQDLQAAVTFAKSDVLSQIPQQKFDLIISNPPYISQDEWHLIDVSVREFEPKSALFAENQGLAIYQKIAEQAPAYLTEQGKIYLEIGFQQGTAVSQILQRAFPEKRVRVLADLFGNPRMVVVD